jgi:hypothetical protein
VAANVAETAQDPAAPFDRDSSITAHGRGAAPLPIPAAAAVIGPGSCPEPAEVLQRLRSTDQVQGPATADDEAAVSAAAPPEPEAPDTPGQLARSTPELLRAHDRAARAAAVAGPLVHLGQPVARSANLAEAAAEPADVVDFSAARTGGGCAPAAQGGAGAPLPLPDTVPDLLAAAHKRAGGAPEAGGSWEEQGRREAEAWEADRVKRGGAAEAPAAHPLLGQSSLEGSPPPPPAPAAAAATHQEKAAAPTVHHQNLPDSPRAGGADGQRRGGMFGGVLSAIGRMLQHAPAAPAEASAEPGPTTPGAPPAVLHRPKASLPAQPPPAPAAAAAPRDALTANARLMSQLSHGRAGQGPKALGVDSDSRLSVAGSSTLPSHVPSVGAMSDSEAPPPPPLAPPAIAPPPEAAHAAGAPVVDQAHMIDRVVAAGQALEAARGPAPPLHGLATRGARLVPGAGEGASSVLAVTEEVLLAAGLDPDAGAPPETPNPGGAAHAAQQRQHAAAAAPAVVQHAGVSVGRMAAMMQHAVEMGLASEEDVSAEQPAAVADTAAAALAEGGSSADSLDGASREEGGSGGGSGSGSSGSSSAGASSASLARLSAALADEAAAPLPAPAHQQLHQQQLHQPQLRPGSDEGDEAAAPDDIALGVWPCPAGPGAAGAGEATAAGEPDRPLAADADAKEGGLSATMGCIPEEGEEADRSPRGGGFGDMALDGAREVGVGEIAGAQELLAADTSRAPGGAVAAGTQPMPAVRRGAGEAEDEADVEEEEEEEPEGGGRLGVTLADVVGLAVAPPGSRRFFRARGKAVAAAAAAAGLRAAGRQLRQAVELAEVATAPADVSSVLVSRSVLRGSRTGECVCCTDSSTNLTLAPPTPKPQIVDASAAHYYCRAAPNAAWEGLPRTGDGDDEAAAAAAEADAADDSYGGSFPSLAPLNLWPQQRAGGSDEGLWAAGCPPAIDIGHIPTSPINRVNSTLPLAAELSAQLSVSSAASLDNVLAGAAAAADAPHVAAARGRAGCALPTPAAAPGAVEARNRAALVAAAAAALLYVGVGVREAAAVAETAFSSAAAVEAASEVGGRGGGGGPTPAPEAPMVMRARGEDEGQGPSAPAGAAGKAGGWAEGAAPPLLGPTSPRSAAGAAMMAEKWAKRGDEGRRARGAGGGRPEGTTNASCTRPADAPAGAGAEEAGGM